MKAKFNVLVERDEDGYYVATVPSLPGCHTQAKSLDELIKRAKKAIRSLPRSRKRHRVWSILGPQAHAPFPPRSDTLPEKHRVEKTRRKVDESMETALGPATFQGSGALTGRSTRKLRAHPHTWAKRRKERDSRKQTHRSAKWPSGVSGRSRRRLTQKFRCFSQK